MPSPLLDSVASFLDRHHVEHCTVLLCVSGGVDSMTLWHAMTELSSTRDLTIVVAHAHHGLRGVAADDDQRFVVAVADERHHRCVTDRLDVADYNQEHGSGIEAAARILRYAFFEKAATEVDARFIIVAHSADDVAETFLMHAARGAGLDGLSSHRAVRAIGKHVLLRPLLTTLRRDIEEYAHEHDIRWREDDTNAELHFLRNQIRLRVMPIMREIFGPEVGLRMARSAGLLQGAHSIVTDVMARTVNDVLHMDGELVCINVKELVSHSPALQQEFVRAAVRKVHGESPTHTDTERVMALLTAAKGSKATLTQQITAVREKDSIVMAQAPSQEKDAEVVIPEDGLYVAGSQRLTVTTQPKESAKIELGRSTASIDASTVIGQVVWRPWTDGDRFTPFGMDGSVLVSDLLTNEKVKHTDRRSVRVLADDDGILWVCGIRPAERTRVTDRTEQVMTVKVEAN